MSVHRDSRLAVGAFIGGVALVFIGLMVVARYPSLIHRGREYRTYFRSVAGLNVGDEVRYGGLPVGSISAMELNQADPTVLVVKFRVSRKTPVKSDTRAMITQVGFLGEPYLNLQPGRTDSPALPPGSIIPSDEQLSLGEAMTKVAAFLDRADTVLMGAERVVRVTPWDRIDRIFNRLDTLVVAATASSDRVFLGLDQASARLNTVLERTERVVAAIDTTVATARPELATTQREMVGTLREMRILVGDLRDAMQEGGGVDNLMRNVSAASDNLARLTERLERDPTSVLKSRAVPKKVVGPKP